MAKKDSELFERLRLAGLRKEVAKALSQTTESAGKKAQGTARAAVKELRALADEIERRLPSTTPAADASAEKAAPAPRPRRSTARSTKPSGAAAKRTAPAKPRATRSTAPTKPRATRPTARPPAEAPTSSPAAPQVSAADGDAPTVEPQT